MRHLASGRRAAYKAGATKSGEAGHGGRVRRKSGGGHRRQPRHRPRHRGGLRARGRADRAGRRQARPISTPRPRRSAGRRARAADGGRRPAHAERLRGAVRRGEGALRPLRRADQQRRRHPRRQIPRPARRRLDRRLRLEVLRRRAADAPVLAAAERSARQCHLYRRRCRAHAGAGLPHRQFGQCGGRQLRQGPRRARQPRRHQRQCHPSRPDRDRPRGAVVRAVRQGAGQDAGRGTPGVAGEERRPPHRPAGGHRGAWPCSCAATPRATSRVTAIAVDGGTQPGYY